MIKCQYKSPFHLWILKSPHYGALWELKLGKRAQENDYLATVLL